MPRRSRRNVVRAQSCAIAFVALAIAAPALGQATQTPLSQTPGGEPLSGRALQEQNAQTLKAAQEAYMEAADYAFRNGATLRTVPTQDPISAELFSNGARFLTVSSDGPIGEAFFSNPAVLQKVIETLPRPPEPPPPVAPPPPAPPATASASLMSEEPPPALSPATAPVATESEWSWPAPPAPQSEPAAPRRVTAPVVTAPPVEEPPQAPAPRPVEATPSAAVRLRPVLAVFGGMARALGVAAIVIFLATLTIYAFSLSMKPDARRARRRLSRSPFKKL